MNSILFYPPYVIPCFYHLKNASHVIIIIIVITEIDILEIIMQKQINK